MHVLMVCVCVLLLVCVLGVGVLDRGELLDLRWWWWWHSGGGLHCSQCPFELLGHDGAGLLGGVGLQAGGLQRPREEERGAGGGVGRGEGWALVVGQAQLALVAGETVGGLLLLWLWWWLLLLLVLLAGASGRSRMRGREGWVVVRVVVVRGQVMLGGQVGETQGPLGARGWAGRGVFAEEAASWVAQRTHGFGAPVGPLVRLALQETTTVSHRAPVTHGNEGVEGCGRDVACPPVCPLSQEPSSPGSAGVRAPPSHSCPFYL